MEAALAQGNIAFATKVKTEKVKKKSKTKVSNEDAQILAQLNKVVKDLHIAQASFEIVTDEILIDCFIYEICALNKKYEYYSRICRERGLIAEGFKG